MIKIIKTKKNLIEEILLYLRGFSKHFLPPVNGVKKLDLG